MIYQHVKNSRFLSELMDMHRITQTELAEFINNYRKTIGEYRKVYQPGVHLWIRDGISDESLLLCLQSIWHAGFQVPPLDSVFLGRDIAMDF